ncbi:MAG: hypothetical protein AAF581_20055 [Planctomycetota bacterium]
MHEIFFLPQQRPQRLLKLARGLTPIVGGLPHDLAAELRYAGGWIARGAREEVVADIERVCNDQGIGVASGTLSDDVLVHAVKRAVRGDENCELHASHWSRTLSDDDIALASLWVFGKVGPADELRTEAPPKRRDSFQQHVEALPLPHAELREGLEGVDLEAPRLVLLLVQQDPLEVFQLTAEETTFPDLGPLGFVDALLTDLPPHKLLAETKAAREAKDFSGIVVHRSEEIARRASWLAALVHHDRI